MADWAGGRAMSWRGTWQARWQAASAREQGLLLLALALVGLALLWWLALAPALAVLKRADLQHQQLGTQLQQMQQMQAQAQALQALPTLDAREARSALEAALKPLGSAAQISTQMDRLTVTLKGVEASALVQVLSVARQNAHLAASEARLKRAASGAWDGSLVFTLPAQ